MYKQLKLASRIPIGMSAIILASLTLMASSTVHASGNYGSQPVTIYQHINFRGRSLNAGAGDISISDLRNSVGNDTISSIEIAPGYEVFACQHSSFRGRCETFTGTVSDLRGISFNDVISSLRVSKAPTLPVTVFEHINFRGNSLSVGEGDVSITDLRNSTVGNDRISSIRIADGYEVVACQHSRHRGRCETFTSDVTDLRQIHFNDVISSLKVQLVSDPVDVNTPPQITPIAPLAVTVGDRLEVTLVANDADGDTLEFTATLPGLTSASSNVTDGFFEYDPSVAFANLAAGEQRTVTLNYSVSDGTDTVTASLDIVVTGTFVQPNNPPVINPIGPLATNASTPIDFTVFASDPDGQSLNVTVSDLAGLSGQPFNFTYDPRVAFGELPVGETATVSFNYSVSDGMDEVSVTISITVTGTFVEPDPENNAPVITSINAPDQVDVDSSAAITVVASDADAGQTLTFSSPSNGVSPTDNNGGFTFNPGALFPDLIAGQNEDLTLTFEVSDGEDTVTETIDIRVVGVRNVLPEVEDLELTTPSDSVLAIDLTDSITDANADTLTIEVETVPGLTGEFPDFSYDPSVEFSDLPVGKEKVVTIDYSANDGPPANTVDATITITVTGTRPYTIGDTGPGGGIVFSVSPDGSSGLEFAPEFISGVTGIAWGCVGTDVPGIPEISLDDNGVPLDIIGNPNEVQTGLLNSFALSTVNCVPTASFAATDYVNTDEHGNTFDDWYLPSITELLEIRNSTNDSQLLDQSTGAQASRNGLTLWSSTEHTSDLVYVLNPIQTTGDTLGIPNKMEIANAFGPISVLPIRSFDVNP